MDAKTTPLGFIRILADDLTGALDTAAVFSGKTPVFIDRAPAPGEAYFDAPISVVGTPTRDVLPESLSSFLEPVMSWFCSGTLAFKKVDSLLRGNTLTEIAWITHAGLFDQAVFAPAFPEQGRVTRKGQHGLASVKNDETVFTPVAKPLDVAFKKLSLPVSRHFSSATKNAPSVWIPDVTTNADLASVIAHYEIAPNASKSLWCGSAGLASAFARYFGRAADQETALASPEREQANWPLVLISASYHPVLREQWQCLCAAVKDEALICGAEASDIAATLSRLTVDGQVAFFGLSPSESLLSADHAAKIRDKQLEQLVAGLPRPGQLMVIGGDTLLAVCRASGANALLAEASGRSGWGCASLIGGKWDGVRCYSRSGAFGSPDDLLCMFRRLTPEI